MSLSGLAFMFDIIVEDLKSYVPAKKFVIKSQFADIFSLVLKNPASNERKRKRKKLSKKKVKAKNAKNATASSGLDKQSSVGQTLLYVGDVDKLMSYMMHYPMEVCLCSEYDPKQRIGSAVVPWNPTFIEYIISLYQEDNPAPAMVQSVHSVFHEETSKRMAAIRLNIKLRITDHINFNHYRVLSKKHPNTFILMDMDQLYTDQSSNTKGISESHGTIKTIYRGGKKVKRSSINKRNAERDANIAKLAKERDQVSHPINKVNTANSIPRSTLIYFTRSDTDIAKPFQIALLRPKSCTDITEINLFNYIFGDRTGPFGNNTYTVGYVTVENTKSKSQSATSVSPLPTESPDKTSSKSSISLDRNLTTTVKCDTVSCIYKKERPLLEKPDDRVLLDITSLKHSCCVTDTIERKIEVVGGQAGEVDPCYCACECSFGFERKTTYCRICKGYEKRGEDLDGIPQYKMPDPCPVYHKISRIKTGSTSGSDTKKESKKRVKSPEPEKDQEKEKKKNKNERFKFNYGYKGIPPQIGHSRCVLPCTGTMSNVPKHMGWLWTADNVPGLMFRPSWRPGAINKVVARKLRMAQHPGQVIGKRRKVIYVKKRPLKRPLLVVHKKEGEFTVTMETMKSYNKPRTLNQQPYEDKPVLTYTIGRTEQENRVRTQKKERAARRLEREQRHFIQNAFTDMCKEICLKTYQQALGLLPDAEDPECACYPPLPDPNRVDGELSCSCSDEEDSLASDTDSDEWILEFTPPNAFYDPNFPGTKVKTVDNESQYTYLDYRVKLLDRYGNPVPRFFKGPDGKEQCSDLGGFWSPDNHWLQINDDGFIGPDGRWAPMTFFGPGGDQVECPNGKFQDAKGNWLVVGVDGYVDCNNKWKFYKHPMGKKQGAKAKYTPTKSQKKPGDKKVKEVKKEETPEFSCFRDTTPVTLSKMGIVGHGPDKKLLNKMLKDLMAKGVNVKLPERTRVPKTTASARSRQRQRAACYASETETSICRHLKPSPKGVVKHMDGSVSYYKLSKFKNLSAVHRMHDLEQQGRSLSTFHEPCFHSTMNSQNRRVVVTMPHAHRV